MNISPFVRNREDSSFFGFSKILFRHRMNTHLQNRFISFSRIYMALWFTQNRNISFRFKCITYLYCDWNIYVMYVCSIVATTVSIYKKNHLYGSSHAQIVWNERNRPYNACTLSRITQSRSGEHVSTSIRCSQDIIVKFVWSVYIIINFILIATRAIILCILLKIIIGIMNNMWYCKI